jgi:hypothetical protein
MMRQLVIFFAFAAALAVPSRGHADPTPNGSPAIFQQGAAEFRAGRFEAAAELFKRAYELSPEPELLLNIAQCYRALGRRSEAIRYLEQFLARAPVDHELRAGAERTLEELRRAEALDRASQPPPPPPRPPEAQPRPLPPPPPPARERSNGSRTWLWATAIGVAVIGGTTAIFIATRPGSSVDDTIRLPPP